MNIKWIQQSLKWFMLWFKTRHYRVWFFKDLYDAIAFNLHRPIRITGQNIPDQPDISFFCKYPISTLWKMNTRKHNALFSNKLDAFKNRTTLTIICTGIKFDEKYKNISQNIKSWDMKSPTSSKSFFLKLPYKNVKINPIGITRNNH